MSENDGHRAQARFLRHMTARPADRIVWGLTLALAAVVLWATLGPSGASGAHLPHPRDKLAHAAGFALLVLPGAVLRPRSLRLIVPMALLLGGMIEVIQPYFGRGREWADFFADALGIAVGAVLGVLIGKCLRYH